MSRRPLRSWAPAVLMPLAALAVHQLRYWLAFGSDVGRQLQLQGHGYLALVSPVVVVIAAVAVGTVLGRVLAAWRTGSPALSGPSRFVRFWVATAVSLLVVYAAQELLEGLLAVGHPGGLGAIFDGGGLWALPAALMVAATFAVLLHGARRAVALAARLHRRRTSRQRERIDASRPREVTLQRRRSPLASASAGRAPPCAM